MSWPNSLFLSLSITVAAAVLVDGRENVPALFALCCSLMGSMLLTAAQKMFFLIKKEEEEEEEAKKIVKTLFPNAENVIDSLCQDDNAQKERKHHLFGSFHFTAEVMVFVAASCLLIATNKTPNEISWTACGMNAFVTLFCGLLQFAPYAMLVLT